MSILAHEIRHCYQHELIRVYERLNKDEKELAVFNAIGEFKKSSESYVSYDDDVEGYYTQEIEEDAYEYGNNRASVYEKIITEFLEK